MVRSRKKLDASPEAGAPAVALATLSRAYADAEYRAKFAAWVDYNCRVAGYLASGASEHDAQERAAKETLAALRPDRRAWRRRTIAEAKRLFESGPPAALAIEGKFVYVNQAAADALDKDRKRLIGQPASLIDLHNREAPLAARVFLSHVEPPYYWKNANLAAWKAERARLARTHPDLEKARVRIFDPLAERPRSEPGALEIWYPGPYRIEERILEEATRIAQGRAEEFKTELAGLLRRMLVNLDRIDSRHVEIVEDAAKGQASSRRRAFQAALREATAEYGARSAAKA